MVCAPASIDVVEEEWDVTEEVEKDDEDEDENNASPFADALAAATDTSGDPAEVDEDGGTAVEDANDDAADAEEDSTLPAVTLLSTAPEAELEPSPELLALTMLLRSVAICRSRSLSAFSL